MIEEEVNQLPEDEVLNQQEEILEEAQEEESNEEVTEESETQEESQEEPESVDSKQKAREAYEARQAKKSALKLENEHLKRKLEALEGGQQQQRQAPIHNNMFNPSASPKLDDFDNFEDFLEARDAHRDYVRNVQEKEKKLHDTFSQQMAEYSAKNKSFLDEVESSSVILAPHLVAAIRNSINAPKVLHEIVKNEALAHKLNSLDAMSLMREVVLLEGKTVEKKVVFSSAKKPIKAPSGSSVSVNTDISTMSGREYREFMNKKKYKG